MYSVDNQLKIEDFVFLFGKLDKNNRWVKLAYIIPCLELEQSYSKQFINNGRPSKIFRIVSGSLIIKEKLNCSDLETVLAISENPYLQYSIGLKEFQNCDHSELLLWLNLEKEFLIKMSVLLL
ncbi:transposase [Clostridium neonatale]|uniref:transposase n=1 Tax=Clostridium neonatale TaxID=137838 RepID=UPI003D3572E2